MFQIWTFKNKTIYYNAFKYDRNLKFFREVGTYNYEMKEKVSFQGLSLI